MMLILPGGLLQAALIVIATCYSGAGDKAARNYLLGIRIWSTVFSDEAWRAGHRAGIPYGWLLAALAVVSLSMGIWLIQWDPSPSDLIVTGYTLGTLVTTLAVTGLMILAAHRAAKQVAVEQVLAEEGEQLDAVLAYKDEAAT